MAAKKKARTVKGRKTATRRKTAKRKTTRVRARPAFRKGVNVIVERDVEGLGVRHNEGRDNDGRSNG